MGGNLKTSGENTHFTDFQPFFQVSHEKKSSYFPLYWLFNRDPYHGLFIIIAKKDG